MVKYKKKTGKPSCHPLVRREKNVAHAIQDKCATSVLADDEMDDKGSLTQMQGDQENENTTEIVEVAVDVDTNDGSSTGGTVGSRRRSLIYPARE